MCLHFRTQAAPLLAPLGVGAMLPARILPPANPLNRYPRDNSSGFSCYSSTP